MILFTEIHDPQEGASPGSFLERMGNWFQSPARLFLGRSYSLERTDGKAILKSPEIFWTLSRTAAKIAAIALFPLSISSALFGCSLKLLAHRVSPALRDKYSLPTLMNARLPIHFAGALPQNPLTPNCVNSQQKSRWGKLYDADPIDVPKGLADPLAQMKKLFETADEPFFQASNARLIEESCPYLHYEYTVTIPKGPLKGTYIDDVDLYFDEEKGRFDIRSASRVGFRDAVHFNFSIPGANKKRVETIRSLWELKLKNLKS